MHLLGEDSWKLSVLWILSYVSFTFTDFNLHSFAVITWFYEYDSLSEFCEPSSQSSKLKEVFRIPGSLPSPLSVHNLIR